MLAYPAWLSALDRELIESALNEVCPPVFFILGARDPDPFPLVSEAVAVQRVLTVAQVVASRLRQPFPEERRRDLEDLLAEIISRVAKTRARPKSPLQDFETMVQDALRACPWWPSPKAAKKRTPLDASRRKAERGRVVLSLLDDLDWTPSRWAAEAGVSPHVTIGYLEGTSTPRKVNRQRITYVLAHVLKQPTLRLPE